MKSNAVTVLIVAMLVLVLGPVQATGQDVKTLMSSYIDALINGDYEGAAQFWHPQYIETCNRLGITYRDIPYKYDCMSPLLQNMAPIRDGSASWTTTQTTLGPQHHKLILKIHTPERTVSYDYFFLDDSTGIHLIPRFWLHLNNLSVVKTRYFDVFYRNESQLNDFALFDLDRFIELTLTKLGATEEKIEALKEQRMEYFLAETQNEVSELLGFSSHGMFFAPSDIIISRYLPDYHELALFALSYTQDNLGLYTAPFISQGLACSFGGRFGQAREVMPQIANFTLANNIYALEDVLTVSDFHTKVGSIDFSYPLSLGLVETLTENYNITGTLKLLSDLSGSLTDVASWTTDDVKAVITGFTGRTWSEIETYSKEKIASDPFPNLKPGVNPGPGQTVFESGTTEYLAKITHDGEWYNVKLTPYSPETRIEGTIVIEGSVGNTHDKFKSFLWNEQFPDIPYINQLYSIRYNPDEIGIYDYLTNRLVAKYVSSFDDGNKIVNGDEISFRFSERIIREDFGSLRCYILEALEDR
jgi:hypothetical protein